MKHSATGGLLLLALVTELHAGGFERTDQSVGVIFEKGRHLELGYISATPDLKGVASNRSPTPGKQSGDIGDDYSNMRIAFKDDISNKMSYAIIYDEPYGANISYPTGTGYFAQGANATLSTKALTGLLLYKFGEPGSAGGGQFSVLGGPRIQSLSASANVPFVNRYTVTGAETVNYGYTAGLAWERPELGMRASLAYTSKIKNAVDSKESIGGQPAVSTVTDVDTPESVNLELQTGLNPQTLLYGSVRWVPWGSFAVSPPVYTKATGSPLAFFKDDRTTYRIGLGRRINDSFLVFGEFGYEQSTGSGTTNLTPVDGFQSYTVGATYRIDRARLTLAYRHADAGDANTILGTSFPAGQFTDNTVRGIGVKVAFDLN